MQRLDDAEISAELLELDVEELSGAVCHIVALQNAIFDVKDLRLHGLQLAIVLQVGLLGAAELFLVTVNLVTNVLETLLHHLLLSLCLLLDEGERAIKLRYMVLVVVKVLLHHEDLLL